VSDPSHPDHIPAEVEAALRAWRVAIAKNNSARRKAKDELRMGLAGDLESDPVSRLVKSSAVTGAITAEWVVTQARTTLLEVVEKWALKLPEAY
jgi:hypothetical protein